MKYRNLAGEQISILGFGCMRFEEDENKKIIREKAFELLRYAYDNGINYYDTAAPYHGGDSEVMLGEFVATLDRKTIKIANKLPPWSLNSEKDMYKVFNEQLKKMNLEYFDFYLLHSLNTKNFNKLMDYNVIKFMDKMKKQGKIKHMGFSFHDNIDVFKKITDSYDWDFIQIQLNYLDENYQAGLEGLNYAKSKNIPTVIMEPLRGGMLGNAPKDIQEVLKNEKAAGMGFKYLWNKENISVVLSGMNNIDHIKENIESASNCEIGMFTKEDNEIIESIKEKYKERIKVDCTGCNYCMPCPAGVDIPDCFFHYNQKSMLNDKNYWHYHGFINENNRADKCVECGKCEPLCPQNISIISKLKEVVKEFKRE